jgi:hypothetical protein
MPRLRLCGLLLAAGLLAACTPGPAPADDVVVFVLDSPVQDAFVEGAAGRMRPGEVTHGSLVARVVRGYCRARIVSVAVAGFEGGVSRDAYLDGLRAVLRHVREHPLQRAVANVSLSSERRDPEEQELIGRLAAAGVLIVAAAGNDDSEALAYPAAYDDVIAVAAATPRAKAPASNYGPHVDIAASGDVTFIDYEFLPYEWLRRRTEADGTSFAAPRVAATVAYVLRARPALGSAEAYALVRAATRPVADDYGRRGLLGAGALDVQAAKAAVAPFYRFVHFVLPVCVWVVLAVLSLYLVLRHALVGVFLTIVIWLVGLPAGVYLALELAGYLEFVGGGSLVVGLAVTGLFGAAFALAALVQGWQLTKSAVALAGPFAAFLVWTAVRGGAGGEALAAGGAAGLVGLLSAAALEALARRRLARVRQLRRRPGPEAVRSLLRLYGRTFDRRVARAAVEALGEVGGDAAVSFLLAERRHPEESVRSLMRIARTDPAEPVHWVGRFVALDEARRRRLFDVLWELRDPELLPHLRAVARQDPTGRMMRLVRMLEQDAGDGGGAGPE